MNIDAVNKFLLRNAVVKEFGKNVSTVSACVQLSAKLEEQGIYLNPQTLRRFFGIISYSGGYSEYTLDSLARFSGYRNYFDFSNRIAENNLSDIFEEASNANDLESYWRLCENLCRKLKESPELLPSVHCMLMKYPLARVFFMENHPIRDLICTVYAQYFSEYLKFSPANQAKLFAYGFLFMGAFLSENEELINLYFQKINQIGLTDDVNLLSAGRKYGVAMMYAAHTKNDSLFAETFSEMLKARENYRSASENSVCSFEYSVLEHLIFTDRFDEMRFLIENNTTRKFNVKEFVPQDRKENHDTVWDIMCGYAFSKMGDVEQAASYLNKVNLDRLSIGWERYYTIIYHLAKLNIAADQEKDELISEIKKLVYKTHFTYYLPLLK